MRQTMVRQGGFISRGRVQTLGDCSGAPPAHSRLVAGFLSVLGAIGGLCLVLLLLHGTIH